MTAQRKGGSIVLFVLLVEFLLGFESGSFQLVLSGMGETFGLDYALLGTLVTVESIAMFLMPLVFGPVADRTGKKRITGAFLGVLAAGCVATALAKNVSLVFVGMFITGAGYGVAECVACAALSDADPERAERNMNTTQAAYSFGAMTGPIIATGVLSVWNTWRAVFCVIAVAAVVVLALLPAVRFLRNSPETPSDGAHGSNPAKLLSAVFICLVVAITLYTGMESGTAYFCDSYFIDVLDAPQTGALALTLFWLAMAISRLLFGLLNTKKTSVVVLLYALSAATLTGFILTRSIPVAVALCTGCGFLYGPVWPQLMATATIRFSAQSGRAASIMMAGAGLGSTLSPLALGMAADAFGLRASFFVLVLSGATGALILGLSGKRRTGTTSG